MTMREKFGGRYARTLNILDENGAQNWAETGRARVADGASSWLDDHGRDLDHALIGGALHDGALDGDPGALGHA